MSIQPLPVPPLLAAVGAARMAVRDAVSAGLARVGDDELASSLSELTGLISQAESLRTEVLDEAQRRRLADRAAATGTDAWAAALTGEKRTAMAGGLWLARVLGEKYEHTRVAFAAGRIGFDQAMVIARAADQAPDDATPDQVAAAEQWLVDRATGDATRTGRPTNAARLRQTARRMFAPLDPDLADRHEAAMLSRQERAAENECWLTMGDNGDGTYSGKFTIPELHGSLLRTLLDKLTAPRRLARDTDGHTAVDASAAPLGRPEIDGTAFCELIEHLPTDGWSAASTATLVVTVDLDHLRAGLASAGLDTGTRISATEARRLACNAGIVPAVMSGPSEVLDLGRARRLHTPAQRRALAVLYDSCAIDTCERPFTWTEIHHPHPWSHGGPTDLTNAAPLCGHHHRRAHDPRFDLRRQPGGGWRLHPRR